MNKSSPWVGRIEKHDNHVDDLLTIKFLRIEKNFINIRAATLMMYNWIHHEHESSFCNEVL